MIHEKIKSMAVVFNTTEEAFKVHVLVLQWAFRRHKDDISE